METIQKIEATRDYAMHEDPKGRFMWAYIDKETGEIVAIAEPDKTDEEVYEECEDYEYIQRVFVLPVQYNDKPYRKKRKAK